MAFKRYIYRHGKKLGPYYYENIRTSDGKVKTIYVGTNPHYHPKHRIRKPLFFLILVLVLILILGSSLFFLQNKAYLIKKVKLQEADFDIDQILLKVLIKSGELIEKQVRVMNTGSYSADININVFVVDDIVKSDASSFAIKPGQTKIVNLKFTSSVPEENIEQQPGIYVGKLVASSSKVEKEIPVVIEIETKNVLFDMNLNPIGFERKIKQGSDTTIEVRMFNLESIESVNVEVEYFVKDMNGNTILTESETVVVKSQASFFKTISVPKTLKPGPYVFAALVKFGKSIGTASYLFEVAGPEEVSFVQFCKNNVLCLGLSLTTILLLFALTAYLYFFIGAFIYERVSGMAALPPKKKEEPEEVEEDFVEDKKLSVFDSIKARANAWREAREERRAEYERIKREKEVQRIVEEEAELEAKRKQIKEQKKLAEPSDKLKQMHKVLDDAMRALEKKAISEQREQERARLQLKGQKDRERKREQEEARKRQLEDEKKKQEELRKQRELEKQNQRLADERRKRLEARQREEEKQNKLLERKKLWEKRKKQAKKFLHKIGFYKTEQEKRKIALEKERQQRIRKEEELSRKRIEQQKKLAEPSDKLKQMHKVLDDAMRALEKKAISELDMLYIKARGIYINLEHHEKKIVYDRLMKLYQQRNLLAKEARKISKSEKKLFKKKDCLRKRKAGAGKSEIAIKRETASKERGR
ncbi:hypothetical protein HYY70_00270 [Candidatus Woesearchaeota archaeon]|nr:hypothetical protein [Candidatus Woesearchaeota archaeon]